MTTREAISIINDLFTGSLKGVAEPLNNIILSVEEQHEADIIEAFEEGQESIHNGEYGTGQEYYDNNYTK